MPSPQQETWARLRPVLTTTLVPVVAALGFFALATYGKKTASVSDQPSMAAFDACLSANNLQPAPSYPSQFDQTVAAQQEMQVCGSKIPPEVIRSWQQQADAAQSSFRDCLRNLGGSQSEHFGRFGGGPSSDFRNAYVICRGLVQNSGGAGSSPIPARSIHAAGPVA